jgi:thiol-disulfide isomerase/thioredoxin
MTTPKIRFWQGFGLGVLAGIPVTLMALLGVGLAISGFLVSRPVSFPDPASANTIAQADYDWPLQRLDGVRTSLRAYQGKTVFLNYWATWCGPCTREMPSIAALAAEFPPGGDVEVVIVSDEAREVVARFLEDAEYDLSERALTTTGVIPKFFAATAVPRTYIIRPDGAVVFQHQGAANWDTSECRSFLRALRRSPDESGPPPDPS